MTDKNYVFAMVGKDRTKAAFASIDRNLTKLRKGINSTQVKFAAGIGGAALTALTKSSFASIDAQAKLSRAFELSIGDQVAFARVVERSGGQTETFNQALKDLLKNTGLAKKGTGEAKDAFAQLNIPLSDFEQLGTSEKVKLLSERISGLDEVTDKAAIANAIFGESGVKLLNTFEAIPGEFDASREAVERLGLAVSDIDAAKVEEANDALADAGLAIKGIGNQIAVEAAPLVTELADRFVDVATGALEGGDTIENAFRTGGRVVGVFADGLRGLEIIYTGLKIGFKVLEFTTVLSLKLMTEGALAFGQGIINGVTLPLRGAIKLAALVSDDAKELLADFEALTTIDEPLFLSTLEDRLNEIPGELSAVKKDLQALLLEELPSNVLQARIDDVLASAEVRAQQFASNLQTKINAPDSGGTLGQTESQAAKDQAEKDALASRLANLETSYLSELGLLQQKLEQEKALLDEALAARVLSEEEAIAKRGRAETRYAQEKLKLERTLASATRNIQIDSLNAIVGAVGSSSKSIFALQKGAALAHAAVTVPAAVLETFRNNGGWPLGILPAAAMAAEGASQIAGMKRQSIGGFGSLPSVGGGGSSGGATAPAIPNLGGLGSQFNQQESQPTVVNQWFVNGDLVTDKQEYLADTLSAAVEAGRIIVPEGSEQALALAASAAASV